MANDEKSALIRISQTELDDMARKHLIYRAGRIGGARAALARHDLSQLSLQGYDLSHADMTGVSLNGADARDGNFNYCNFFGADLRNCRLQGASMIRADLRGACLRGASLIGADLAGVDLREGMLACTDKSGDIQPVHSDWSAEESGGADFSGTNLNGARLSGSVAAGTNFSDATMRNCKIVRANLAGANLSGANLENADLSLCDLSGANMADAILVNVAIDIDALESALRAGAMSNRPTGPIARNLPAPLDILLRKHDLWVNSDGAEGAQLDISGYDMRGTKLFTHARLSLMNGIGAILQGTNLSYSQLQSAFLRNADLLHIHADHSDMRGVDLSGSRLIKANLSNSRFEPLISPQGRPIISNFSNANLRYANLSGANLRQVNLKNADLSYTNLLGTDLSGTDLTETNLTGARLDPELQELVDRSRG